MTTTANENLIAAAPDMLETLYLVLPYIETLETDKGYKPGTIPKVLRSIHEAINKAEGQLSWAIIPKVKP